MMKEFTLAERFKATMQIHGVTHAELAHEFDRSSETVRQRLRNDKTFPKHYHKYKEALDLCIAKKDKEKNKAMEELL